MPRPGPRRPALGVKISADTIKAIDATALALGITRSDWVRAVLDSALVEALAPPRAGSTP